MEMVFTYEDGSQALAHFGVKGMKWGIRKKKREYLPDAKRVAKLKKAADKANARYKAKGGRINKFRAKTAKNRLEYETSGQAAQLRYVRGKVGAVSSGLLSAHQAATAISLGAVASTVASSIPYYAQGLQGSAMVYAGYAAANAVIAGLNNHYANKNIKR